MLKAAGPYLSFTLYSASIVIHLTTLIKTEWLRWNTVAGSCYIAMLLFALALALAERLTRRSNSHSEGDEVRPGWRNALTPAAALSLTVAALVAAFTAVPVPTIYLGIAEGTLLLLFTARIGAGWYALLSLAVGALIGWAGSDIRISAVATAGSAAILFALNYGVHLILDHQREWHQLLGQRKSPAIRQIALRAIWIWLPSAFVINLGLWVNIQRSSSEPA
ncbi:hypothetical protein [Rhizobium ruizarguesonis]|uniref:hypothetical protein n=1 Tax=Rhizobium ruizarguesonis TaxID=2081791 RepID=UPI00102F3BD4|nr:hypothetical protein [Rhizobium ruizarguesonis]TBD47125.1 hypothetical protein ELH17_08530 [Rhizobium ruizarguesonis]